MSNENTTELKDRITVIRKAHNIKKAHFAKKLGISSSYVTDLELGKRSNISTTLAKLIAYEFNVNESWLLTGNGEMFTSLILIANLDETSSEILSRLKSLSEDKKREVLGFMKEKELLTKLASFLEDRAKEN